MAASKYLPVDDVELGEPFPHERLDCRGQTDGSAWDGLGGQFTTEVERPAIDELQGCEVARIISRPLRDQAALLCLGDGDQGLLV
ncbi:MAG: hypothetical protein NNA18_04760 [Nitrospira sp.]|nr:hypothetical protein [Nitrospira sp.]